MMEPIPRNLTSEDMVIALINRDNNLRLSRADVLISNPRVNPSPTEIANTGFMRDTLADLQAVKGGDFLESTPITYRRLDASVVFSKVITVIPPNGQSTTADLLEDINALYGLALRTSDIIAESVDPTKLPFKCNIVFKPDNPAWKGSFPVVVRKVPLDISKYVLSRNLPVLRYPTGQSVLIQGNLYAYSRDFSEYTALLTPFNQTTSFDTLLAMMNTVFKPDVWVNKATAVPFNFGNATVAYNGPIISKYSSRTKFSRVLVIQLDSLCSNMVGQLILHYNA